MIYRLYIPLTILLLFAGRLSIIAQDHYYPGRHDWKQQSPEYFGIDSVRLQRAVDHALANEYSGSRDLRVAILEGFAREPYHELAGPVKKRGGPAGMILKNGYIIAQWGDLDRVDMTFSVTKSFLSTLAGLALDQALIRSVHDRVIDYVWSGTFDGQHNAKITWDHLLTQSSDWTGTLFGMQDWSDRPPREGGIDKWKYRVLNEPGTVYEYNDVRVNVLAFALLQIWREPLPHILKEHIMDPIAAGTNWRWYGYHNSWTDVDGYSMQSVSGGGHSGGGMFINTFDMGRFGLLFLRNGKWNGTQLISEEWIQKAMCPSQAFHQYGYMWWLNSEPRRWDFASERIFFAAGFGGNYIIVDPDHDMVIVTRWLEPSKLDEFMSLIQDAIKNKVQ